MVDRLLILRKIAELETYLSQIREFSGISVNTYREDWKVQRIVERTLQMMIENCMDIAGHIISDKDYRTPQTYADAFKVLAENKILGKTLSTKLENMTKFRNIIVHSYDKIDAAIITNILKKNLNDFLLFKKAILRFLQSQ